MARYDAIIIGAGVNGLVTAAYLAKAGKKVVVLERRPMLGGIATTEEIHPGFKLSRFAHLAGSFARDVMSDLDLEKHGLAFLPIDPPLYAPLADGKGLLIGADDRHAGAEIERFSKKDAANFKAFSVLAKDLSAYLRILYGVTLPDYASEENFNLSELLKVGWKFRRLGEKQMYAFLRALPMSIADLLDEWFDTELLKAALAASGLLGAYVGPRQQGTAFLFLHHRMGSPDAGFRTSGSVRGGIGNLAEALGRATSRYGAQIRTDAEVVRIETRGGAATGVSLRNGDELGADIVVSSADVKTTFLKLVEPIELDPHFLLQIRNIRARGTVAKINFALDRPPRFYGSETDRELSGVIHIGPSLDYLERASDDAKYGRFSKQPFLEITIPSLLDPSLAPAGKHVMSVWMQYAPYDLRDKDWREQREALGETVAHLVEEYAPGFKNSILHREVMTPLDLEQVFGVTGGHVHHAEMALDQIFFMRPIPGWSRYSTPIRNLYLCGSGVHPGGGVTGLPGYYAAKTILGK